MIMKNFVFNINRPNLWRRFSGLLGKRVG